MAANERSSEFPHRFGLICTHPTILSSDPVSAIEATGFQPGHRSQLTEEAAELSFSLRPQAGTR